MSKDKEVKFTWDSGLTHEEHRVIGAITAQWGELEAEVFFQTLESYGEPIQLETLPRAMRNRNFSEVLQLWRDRVAEQSHEPHRSKLLEAHEKITALQDARNAIAHGMWDFSHLEPETVSTFRVKDDKLITLVFQQGALEDMEQRIAELNMTLRYPGGMAAFFEDQMRDGHYVNHAELRRTMLLLKRKSDESA